MTIRLKAAAAAVLLMFAPGSALGADPVRVVATIKPVHALAAAVMGEVAAPELLVRGGGSPHAYALKPSDARALQEARVVIRVGETLEAFLTRAIASLATKATVVSLAGTPGLTLYTARAGGLWETHGHAGHEHHEAHESGDGHAGHAHDEHTHEDSHEEHMHGDYDPHIWLDPENAGLMAAHLADVLGRAYPEHARAFRANARALGQRLDKLDAELRAVTAPLEDEPFILFHDAYRYFEERYGLDAAGAITLSPERPPGARRLSEIRARIRKLGATCVFAEPQFEPELVNTLIEGTQARRGTLDPLGARLEPGPELYVTLMRNLAAGFATCLAP